MEHLNETELFKASEELFNELKTKYPNKQKILIYIKNTPSVLPLLGDYFSSFLNEVDHETQKIVLTNILLLQRDTNEELQKLADSLEENNSVLEKIGRFIESRRKSLMRPFEVYFTPSEEELRKEFGDLRLEYIPRGKISLECLKNGRFVLTGKCGSGKTRILFETLKEIKDKHIAVIRRIYTGDINALDEFLQPLDNFLVVWEDLHKFRDNEIRRCLERIEFICKEKDIPFLLLGTSRKKGTFYGVDVNEIDIGDMRNKKIVEVSAKEFGKSITDEASEILLKRGDGTPEYILSFFKTFRGEKVEKRHVMNLPQNVISLWKDYIGWMNIQGNPVEKVLKSVALLYRGIFLDFSYLRDMYIKVFHGNISDFDHALRSLEMMFFVERIGDEYLFHDSRAEAVEEIFPLEKRDVSYLIKKIILKLPDTLRLLILRVYADWFYYSKNHEFSLMFFEKILEICLAQTEKHKEIYLILVKSYNDIGIIYLELEKFDKALENLNEAIKLESEYAEAYHNRGNLYFELGKFHKALRDYSTAIKMDPRNSAAYYNRGRLYNDLMRLNEALKDYSSAIGLDPELTVAYIGRGIVYDNLEEFDEAVRDFNTAIDLDPEDAEAYNNRGVVYSKLKKYGEAIEDFSVSIELGQKNAEAYNNRGNIYSKLKKFDKAMEDFDKAIELNPECAIAYNNRGIVKYDLGKFSEAIEDCNKALELDPTYAEAYNNRGNVYNKLEEFDKAIDDYTEAIGLNSHLSEAYRARGSIYYKLDRFDDALGDLAKIIELDPKDAVSYQKCADLFYRLKRYEDAIRNYSKIIETDPKNAKIYYIRGNVYLEMRKLLEALEDYSKAIELSPEFAEALFKRGNVHYKLREVNKALEDYSKAIELSPEFAEAYYNRGKIHFESGKLTESIDDYLEAIKSDPEYTVAYNNLGIVYTSLGKLDEAIEKYSEAIQMNPKYTDAYVNRGNVYLQLEKFDEAIRDYSRAIEFDTELAQAFGNRGITYSLIGEYENAQNDFKKAGILFLKTKRFEDSIKAFAGCFSLREKIENDNTIYCGLSLFLLAVDADILIIMKRMHIEDETLERIYKLIMKKLNKKDISKDLEELKGKTEEIELLLELLNEF